MGAHSITFCTSLMFPGQERSSEILAHLALNVFTNYFNKAALTVIDFPRVESVRKAA